MRDNQAWEIAVVDSATVARKSGSVDCEGRPWEKKANINPETTIRVSTATAMRRVLGSVFRIETL